MNFDFAFYLTLAVIVSGVIVILNKFYWAKQRAKEEKESLLVEYARSFFPVLLVVWLIRSFVGQAYRVPTGSLEPTVIPGDLILVSQYAYGLRLPVLHTVNHAAKIFSVGEPKHGQIALFYWPIHPSTVLVKRVIGVPGDHIIYRNKVLTINGHVCQQHFIKNTYDYFSGPYPRPVIEKSENLLGVKHDIWLQAQGGQTKNIDVIVPKGKYFMMGDNRDDSYDSRGWGFVPESAYIGQAKMVLLSWNPLLSRVRWKRSGIKL